MKFLNWLKSLVWCDHEWTDPKTIIDYNFRGGYEHKSVVCECKKCGRFRTFTQDAP